MERIYRDTLVRLGLCLLVLVIGGSWLCYSEHGSLSLVGVIREVWGALVIGVVCLLLRVIPGVRDYFSL